LATIIMFLKLFVKLRFALMLLLRGGIRLKPDLLAIDGLSPAKNGEKADLRACTYYGRCAIA
jgi:hypothetical protein